MKHMCVLAALLAACVFSTFVATPAQAQQNGTILTAQGNPYLVDFFSLQSKRGDVIANVAHKGLNAAFSEWLAVAHPDAYKSAVKQAAFRTTSPGAKVAMRSGRANGSCCVMTSGCCQMCPSCCKQKSCTKGCCNLSACTMRPNCCK